jgi:hypothetical protein
MGSACDFDKRRLEASMGAMNLDLASAFMTTHARLLDRRRFDLVTGKGDPDAVLSALAAYRNDDGGYGWALEPDLRSPESQPAGALHAFEVFEEVGRREDDALRLCDWLASAGLPDGGLPFALPVTDPTGTAPFWHGADATRSSLHITAAVAGIAHRLARHDPRVGEHPWTVRATGYCMREIAQVDRPPHAIELRYVLLFLDAVHDVRPDAPAQLRRLAGFIPEDGVMAVGGGIEGEAMHPLDFSPEPGRPLRDLLPAKAIEADLDRLAALRRDDGGWDIDFHAYSAAAALEWRGYETVRMVKILQAHR